MKKPLFLLPLAALVLVSLFSSCSMLDSDPPIDRERKARDKKVNGYLASFYKGMKIAVRSTVPGEAQSTDQDALGEELRSFYGEFAAFIMQPSDGDATMPEISAGQMVKLGKDLYQLPEKIKDSDEDEYPTIFELTARYFTNDERRLDVIRTSWNNDIEHLALAVLLESSRTVPIPAAWRVYEVSKIHPEKIGDNNATAVAYSYMGLTYLMEGWPYLSEEVLTEGIDYVESGVEFSNYAIPGLVKVDGLSNAEVYGIYCHGVDHLFRGYARMQMGPEKKDASLADIKVFMEDFEKLQIENEIYWIAGCYYYIEMEETDEAIAFLKKLEQSEFLSKRERKSIKEAQEYLENRKPGEALNIVSDKVIMGKIMLRYLVSVASEGKWSKEFESSEPVQNLMKSLPALGQKIEQVESKIPEMPDLDL